MSIELIIVASVAGLAGMPSPPNLVCAGPGIYKWFSCVGPVGEQVEICEGLARSERPRRLHVEVAAGTGESIPVGATSIEMEFVYNHYSRFQTEYLELAGRTSTAEYRVYRHYEGEFGEDEISYGMLVTRLGDGSESRVECKGEVLDKLGQLASGLECDRENALGCGALGQSERVTE